MKPKRPFRQKLKRFLKWTLGTVVVLVLMAILGLRFYFSSVAGELPERQREARQAGVPITETELLAGMPSQTEGAALIYDRALEQYDSVKDNESVRICMNSGFDPDYWGDKPSALQVEMAWKLLTPIIRTLQSITQYPKARLMPAPAPPFFYDFDRFATIKQLIKLLAFRAFEDARQGDAAKSWANLLVAARMTTHIRQQEGLLPMLIGQAMAPIISRAAERALMVSRHPFDWVAPLQAVAKELEPKRSYIEVLRGEAYYSLLVARNPDSLRLSAQEKLDHGMDLYEEPKREFSEYLQPLIGKKNVEQAIESRLLVYWSDVFKAAKKFGSETEEFHKKLLQLEKRYQNTWGPADALAIVQSSVIFDGGELKRRSVAFSEVLAQAADVLGFRRSFHRWPDRPTDLPFWRNDPFADEPLRYVKRPNGFIVYSVDKDRVDDKGRSYKSESAGETKDISFTYPWAPPPKRTSTP